MDKAQMRGSTRSQKPATTFLVAARTIIHLGRELITSDEIAINELIKNAFDAGSEVVDVTICCPVSSEWLSMLIRDVRESDDDFEEIKSGIIQAIEDARFDRECGPATVAHVNEQLSRIAACETVDEAVEILEEVNFIEVVDSGCGIEEESIVPIFLTVGTDNRLSSPKPDGPDQYLGNKGIGRLAMMRLGHRARVTTWTDSRPTAYEVEFDWRAFDTADLQISDIPLKTNRVRIHKDSESGTRVRVFALRSDWTQDGEQATNLQTFIRRLRSPFSPVRKFKIRVKINDGKAMPFPKLSDDIRNLADQHLTLEFYPQKAKSLKDPILTLTLKTAADAESGTPQLRSGEAVRRMLIDVTNTHDRSDVPLDLQTLQAIGPFKLNILRFNRRILREKVKTEWPNVKKELDLWAGGIAIYRDGFRVGFTGSERDGDWLGLDSKALRGSGYVVNRIQVMGALEITHRGNKQLTDLTNREGLISTPEADMLKELLLQVAIQPLRAYVQDEDQKTKQKQLEQLVNDGTATLAERLLLAKQDVNALKDGVPSNLKSSVSSLNEHLHFITTQVKKFEDAIEKSNEGREDILELAGIGNVMHGVMHELTRTTAQTRQLMRELANKADDETQQLLTKLETEIRAINVRLQQMDPLMPGARQIKREIEVEKLTRTIVKGYESLFARNNIDSVVTVTPKGALLKVKMVPGFLSLALENLVSNSTYWLSQRDDPRERGLITIEIDVPAKTIAFKDNGPGIDFADRDRIFLPGFSLRKGKGYGLYLAREVSEYHNGRLYLDPQTDDDGRLRTFILELPRTE
ncbi:sensor histidine kinase [Pseudomonas sp. ACN8]|jgi:signal transduction histidine kinase|uniref:ATP-binding protein n=1 Tax=Pseudomonas sp. ACN8 TaxID=1920428 RepID=UPI001552A8F2|nr:sensor histidine kinase [Pseudomonas sp. ACN8]